MNKRLLFVAPSAYPLGGVAVWLDYLLHGLEVNGWQVTPGLVGGVHHDVSSYGHAYPRLKNIIEISNATGSREGRINSLMAAIDKISPDLVIGVNIPDTYEAVNRLRNRKHHAPHVAMAIHGIQPDLFEDMGHYRNVLDGVICTNRLTMRLVQKDVGFDVSRLHYAPYGVDSGQASLSKELNSGILRITWVGRLEQFQKRVLDLLPIMKALVNRNVDFELLIAGGGPEEVAFREALEQEQLTRFVRFLGVVPPEEMQSRVYDACDVLLVTSYWETGPIIIWEAMASGVPVVSSRYIGSGLEAGLVHGENCLLFDIGDAESAATQLQKLCEPEYPKRLVAGGHELVSNRYSKRISIQGWDRAFREVLNLRACQPVSPRIITPSGKLDRMLGTRLGELVRHSLGLSHQHATTGGEWPHSYGRRKIDDRNFWSRARSLDEREAE